MMQPDPWLSDARREAQRQREWCLRDRGSPIPRLSLLARLVLRSALQWLAMALTWGVAGAVCWWALVEVLS